MEIIRILVADDLTGTHKTFGKFVSMMQKKFTEKKLDIRIEITSVFNGLDAAKKYKEAPTNAPFDFVIMDGQMPGGNGSEGILPILQHNPRALIFVYSAMADKQKAIEKEIEEIRNLNPEFYDVDTSTVHYSLPKPCSLKAFYNIIGIARDRNSDLFKSIGRTLIKKPKKPIKRHLGLQEEKFSSSVVLSESTTIIGGSPPSVVISTLDMSPSGTHSVENNSDGQPSTLPLTITVYDGNQAPPVNKRIETLSSPEFFSLPGQSMSSNSMDFLDSPQHTSSESSPTSYTFGSQSNSPTSPRPARFSQHFLAHRRSNAVDLSTEHSEDKIPTVDSLAETSIHKLQTIPSAPSAPGGDKNISFHANTARSKSPTEDVVSARSKSPTEGKDGAKQNAAVSARSKSITIVSQFNTNVKTNAFGVQLSTTTEIVVTPARKKPWYSCS